MIDDPNYNLKAIMSADESVLNEKLSELFTQFKDIISEIKEKQRQKEELQTENDRMKSLYHSIDARSPSEIKPPNNTNGYPDLTCLSIDVMGPFAEVEPLKVSTKSNRECYVQDVKKKAEIKAAVGSLTNKIKIEKEALEKVEKALEKVNERERRVREALETLTACRKQLHTRVEKRRLIDDRLNFYSEKNQSLLQILQVLMPIARQKSSQLGKTEHDDFIRRFHKDQKEMMKNRIWGKEVSRVFCPSDEILESQEAYLQELKKAYEQKRT